MKVRTCTIDVRRGYSPSWMIRDLRTHLPRAAKLPGSNVPVRHPEFVPNHWKRNNALQPNALNHAARNGWQLLDFSYDSRQAFLIPPEPVLAQMISATTYAGLHAHNIVQQPMDTHNPTCTPIHEELQRLLDHSAISVDQHGIHRTFWNHGAPLDERIDTGDVLIKFGNSCILCDPLTRDEFNVGMHELWSLHNAGLIRIRANHRQALEYGPRTTLSKRPTSQLTLDAETFLRDAITRWQQPSAAAPHMYTELGEQHVLHSYPRLRGWYERHAALLLPEDCHRVARNLTLLESSSNIQQSRGIAEQIKGHMAAIALREQIWIDYDDLQTSQTEPVALLLRSQFRDAQGLQNADAIALSTTPNGYAVQRVYEVSLRKDHSELQARIMQRLEHGFHDGIVLVNSRGARQHIPIHDPIVPPAQGLDATLDAGAAVEIDNLVDLALQQALTQLPAPHWNSSAIPVTPGPQNTGVARPNNTLSTLSTAELNAYAADAQTTRLVLTGSFRGQGTKIIGFTVHTAVPPLAPTYFAVTLQRHPDGYWAVESLAGQTLVPTYASLQANPHLHTPSPEWLDRNVHSTLTSFRQVDDFKNLNPATLDRWSEEWQSDTLTVSARLSHGKIKALQVEPTAQQHPRAQTFAITFTKADDGHWHISAAEGIHVRPIIDALRQATAITIPSNEWLSRNVRIGFTSYDSVDTLQHIDAQQLDQWAHDWQSAQLAVSGFITSAARSLSGLSIATQPADALPKGAFEAIYRRSEEGHWTLAELQGTNLPRALQALRRSRHVTVRSDEWLGRNAPRALNNFTNAAALSTISTTQLNQWASEWGSTRLTISATIKKSGTVSNFAINAGATRATAENGFFLSIERHDDNTWHVTDVSGVNVTHAIAALRKGSALHIPSNEWLSRGRRESLSTLLDTNAWQQLSPDDLDRWDQEWNGNGAITIVGTRGNSSSKVSSLAIMPQAPTTLREGHFALGFVKSKDGTWRLEDVAGRGVRKMTTLLRDAGHIAIPSPEWLTQQLESNITDIKQVAQLADISRQQFEQWRNEYQSTTLVLTGRVRTDKLQSFSVSTIQTNAGKNQFAITLQQAADGTWSIQHSEGKGQATVTPLLTQALAKANTSK